MRVHNLKGLRTLMVVRDVSQRRLARAAGYRSHSYLGRILRGEVDTLEPEAAVRIARFLEVGTDFLFAPTVSTTTAQSVRRRSTADERSNRTHPGRAHPSTTEGRNRWEGS
jgi:transcriptional regulator with XRE-family HTH domain